MEINSPRRAWNRLAAAVLFLLAIETAYCINETGDAILGEIPPNADKYLPEAAECFKNARVSDKIEQNYAGCIAKINGILGKGAARQTELRCHYYLSFAYFMNKDYPAAYVHARKMLALALALHPDNRLVKYTSALAENIRNGDIESLEDVNISMTAQNMQTAAGLSEDLNHLATLKVQEQENESH